MAFVVGRPLEFRTPDGDVSGSITVTLPNFILADDHVLIIVSNDSGSSATAVTGFAEVTGTAQARFGSTRSSAWLRKITGADSAPVITGSTQSIVGVLIVVRDADTATPIDIALQNNVSSVATVDSPSVTTTTDDCLIIRAVGGWDTSNSECVVPPGYRFLGRAYTDTVLTVVAEQFKKTAGATGTFLWELLASDGGSAYTIAFKNKSGGSNPVAYDSGVELIRRYGNYGAVYETTTWTNLESSITTLAGQAVLASAPSGTDDDQGLTTLDYLNATELLFPYGGPNWQGATHPISTLDATGRVVSVSIASPRADYGGELGVVFILFDSTGNWSAFNYPLSEISNFFYGYTLFVSESTTPLDSSGALDWSDLVKVGYAWDKTSTSTSSRGVAMSGLVVLGPAVFTGGGANNPVRPSNILDYMYMDEIAGQVSLQASGQALVKRSVSIGDGVSPLHWVASRQSMEMPQSSEDWKVAANEIGYEVKASSDCVIDFSASITATSVPQDFTIDAASHVDAEYYFNGAAIIGYLVTWNSDVPCVGASFIACDVIDAKSADFAGVTVAESISTTHAVHVDAGGSVQADFTKGEETYAIQISAAGSYDLTGSTFTGYTTELDVTAVSGTVTIALAPGQTVPAYTSAGATIVFDNATVVTVKVTATSEAGLVQNARVRLEAAAGGPETLGTVLLEGLTDVNGELEDTGYVFTTDQPVVGTVRKSSGSPHYAPGKLGGSITSSGYNTETFLILDE